MKAEGQYNKVYTRQVSSNMMLPLLPRRLSTLAVTMAVLWISSSTSSALIPPQQPKATAVIRLLQPSSSKVLLYSKSSSDKNKSGSNSDSIMSNLPDVDLDSLQQYLPNLSNLWDARESVWRNVVDGELGQRGEFYTAAQLLALACVAIGGVPFVGGLVSLVCGPVLLLLGVYVLRPCHRCHGTRGLLQSVARSV